MSFLIETEAIAVFFTFGLFDGLSTTFVDFNLKIMRKVINYQAQNGCF